jgi:hypothetical protein
LLEWFNMWYLQPWLRTGQGPKWFVVLREMHLRLLRLSVSEYMQILLPWSLPKRTKSMRSMWWKLQSLHIRPKLFILSLWVWFIEWKLHKANKKLYTVTFEWQMFSLQLFISALFTEQHLWPNFIRLDYPSNLKSNFAIVSNAKPKITSDNYR